MCSVGYNGRKLVQFYAMSPAVHVCQPIPVTAILPVESLCTLLVARGSFLYLVQQSEDDFDNRIANPRYRVFEKQQIHGLAQWPGDEQRHIFIAWGGQYIRIFTIKSLFLPRTIPENNSSRDDAIILSFASAALKVPDRILDATFIPSSHVNNILILTAHNEIYLVEATTVQQSKETREVSQYLLSCTLLCQNQNVILYCGHIIYDDHCLVVASGTTFGQVLLWKLEFEPENLQYTATFLSLASFHVHEGSVFGVRIRDPVLRSQETKVYHIASCSDDRTVCVYQFDENQNEEYVHDTIVSTGFVDSVAHGPPISQAFGTSSMSVHLSRIWSIRWLGQRTQNALLLSFGEDTSTQAWRVNFESIKTLKDSKVGIRIESAFQFKYHTGKNIWSTATSPSRDNERTYNIYTGGADGRTVHYKISEDTDPTIPSSRRYVIDQTPLSTISRARHQQNNIQEDAAETLFKGFEGEWSLHRVIISKRPEYPSGNFDGKAIFTRRPVTDPSYDAEMLYSEDGTFVVNNGFTFPARRNYVYRYQKTSKTITAWFVKPDANDVVDYLFHQVDFKSREGPDRLDVTHNSVTATGYHLCVRDNYNAAYTFNQHANKLNDWTLTYFVTGPEKDYTARSHYSRNEDKVAQNPDNGTGSQLTSKINDETDPVIRGYCWLDLYTCLLTTEGGDIFKFDIQDEASHLEKFEAVNIVGNPTYGPKKINAPSELIIHGPLFKSYSLLKAIPSLGGALIADGSGGIHFLSSSTTENGLNTCQKLWEFESKVSFIDIHVKENNDTQSSYDAILQCVKSRQLFYMQFSPSQDHSSSSKDIGISRVQELPSTPRFTVTSSVVQGNLILCGSRTGRLLVYHYSMESAAFEAINDINDPKFSIHERDTVTSIVLLKGVVDDMELQVDFDGRKNGSAPHWRTFMTTGRDGTVKRHKLKYTHGHLEFMTVSALRLPFGPFIEGLKLSADHSRYFVWGFDGGCFVCWDLTSQNEVSRISCGNSHRNWDFELRDTGHTVSTSLVWTQAGSCNVYHQPLASHKVLLLGGHGREIKAIDSMELNSYQEKARRRIVATGAEDTDIRLYEVSYPENYPSGSADLPSFRCIATVPAHITGLTALKFVPASNILLSSGGKEELFAWKVQVDESSDYFPPNFLRIGKCPKVTSIGDLRITGLDVIPCDLMSDIDEGHAESPLRQDKTIIISATYSDSSLRIWSFDVADGSFKLLAETTYSTKCLTCLAYARVSTTNVLVAGSTDGNIIVYKVVKSEKPGVLDTSETTQSILEPLSLLPMVHCKAHQSAVKDIAMKTLDEKSLLIVTGGDDNGVAFTRIALHEIDSTVENEQSVSAPLAGTLHSQRSLSPKNSSFPVAKLLIPNAHAAAVNAVNLIKSDNLEADEARATAHGAESIHFVTASNDQRVKVWHVDVTGVMKDGNIGLDVRRKTLDSDIADAAGLTCFDNWIVVAGVGIEILDRQK